MSDAGRAPTRLFLVRHGHVHNPREIAYGHLPRFGLDAEGRAQAHAAGAWLADRGIDALYTSPLLRARQTARIIRSLTGPVPLHTARGLRESELGRVWQGNTWRAIEEQDPTLFATWMATPSRIALGETMEAMAERVRRVCIAAARRYPGRSIALVSHRDPILALRLSAESGDLDAMHRTPSVQGSVTELLLTGADLRFVRYAEPSNENGPRGGEGRSASSAV